MQYLFGLEIRIKLRRKINVFLSERTPEPLANIKLISNPRFTVSKFFLFSSAITDFREGPTFKGFTNENGQIKVTKRGFYYIYAQVFFEPHFGGPVGYNRVALTVNGDLFALLQASHGSGGADYGSSYTGGVIKLKRGDTIGLMTATESRLWVNAAHTFFGAYKIY